MGKSSTNVTLSMFCKGTSSKKKKNNNNKSTNQLSDVYEKLHEINNLIRSQQSNINLKKEKDEILKKYKSLKKKFIMNQRI